MEIPTSLFTTMRLNFLYVDKYLFKQGWVFPENYVPYCILRYILKGRAVFSVDGAQYTVHQDQVAYIPDGCMLECHSLDDEFEFISIRFVTTAQLNGNDFLKEFFHIAPITDASNPILRSYFQEVYENATSENSSRLFRIRGNLELIIALLIEQQDGRMGDGPLAAKDSELGAAQAPDLSSIKQSYRREVRSLTIKRDARIQAVVEYLVANPTQSLDIPSLCEIAQMSSSSLRRHFKEHTGKTPGEFMKELRVMVAARKLLVTNERISSIAYELGFTNQNYFSRIFKQIFGVSPSQYRKSSRE